MRSSAAIIALAALAVAAPVAAQSRAFKPAADLVATAPDPDVQQMRDALAAGDLPWARRLARTIARTESSNAATYEALWLIAQMEHADHRPISAANALDRAAEAAQAYGDPVAQARALLESATIYARSYNFGAASARIARLRPLLESPHMTEELRAEITNRLASE